MIQDSSAVIVPARRTTFFELGILVVMGLLFFWFIIKPKTTNIAAQKLVSESLSAESDKLADQQAKIDSLIRQLEASSQDLSKLDEALPMNPRNTSVYLLVESLVQSSGMAESSLSVANTDEFVAANSALAGNPFSVTRIVKKVPVNLVVTGSFAQFQALLKKLENSSRIIDIKTLDISAAADGLLDFRISFDTYYFGISSG